MSNEELLAKAKKDYTPGVKFICLVTKNAYTIPSNITFKYEGGCIYSYQNENLFHKHYENFTKKWAEIVSKPETKSDNLTIDDLVEGEIYRINHESNDTYIISTYKDKHDKERINGRYITNMNGDWKFRPSSYAWVKNRKITTATSQEKKWLNTCILGNKFIDQEKAIKISNLIEEFETISI